MCRVLVLVLVLVLVSAGCQDRRFVNLGRGPQGADYGIAAASVDRYAKEHRLSREEAVEQLRKQQELAAKTAKGSSLAGQTTGSSRPLEADPLDEGEAGNNVQPADSSQWTPDAE